MLQAFRLELQYAAMKQQEQHEKETEDNGARGVGGGNSATAPSDKEAQQLSREMDGQHQETGNVSDQVHKRVERTVFGHKASIKSVYKTE